MSTVFKFNVPFEDNPMVVMPVGAKVIHFASQGDSAHDLFIWAVVPLESGAAMEERWFRLAGTGHSIDPGLTYIGTAHAGNFVWHLFEASE